MCRIELDDRASLQHFGSSIAQHRGACLAASLPWAQHSHFVRSPFSHVRMWAACKVFSFRLPIPGTM
jgi:hypothetical protein